MTQNKEGLFTTDHKNKANNQPKLESSAKLDSKKFKSPDKLIINKSNENNLGSTSYKSVKSNASLKVSLPALPIRKTPKIKWYLTKAARKEEASLKDSTIQLRSPI